MYVSITGVDPMWPEKASPMVVGSSFFPILFLGLVVIAIIWFWKNVL